MCERTRKKLNSIKTINGLMTSGTKEALDVMLDELESMTAKVARLSGTSIGSGMAI